VREVQGIIKALKGIAIGISVVVVLLIVTGNGETAADLVLWIFGGLGTAGEGTGDFIDNVVPDQ